MKTKRFRIGGQGEASRGLKKNERGERFRKKEKKNLFVSSVSHEGVAGDHKERRTGKGESVRDAGGGEGGMGDEGGQPHNAAQQLLDKRFGGENM